MKKIIRQPQAQHSGFGLRASGLISSPLQFWLMLLLLAFSHRLAAQFECGGAIEPSSFGQPKDGFPCGTNANANVVASEPFYGNNDTWMPIGDTPLQSPPTKTIRLAFHIIQPLVVTDDSDTFKDTWEDRELLREIVRRANEIYNGSLIAEEWRWVCNPSDPVLAAEQELANCDARIRITIEDGGVEQIHFYNNDAMHNSDNDSNLQNFIESQTPAFPVDRYLNVHWVKYGANLSGHALLPNYGNLEANSRIVMYKGRWEGQGHEPGAVLAHEVAHTLGGHHTYIESFGGGHAICDEDHPDFLSDVVGTGTCPHPNAAWATYDPYDEADEFVAGGEVTNNILGGASTNAYKSPMQAGIMHRTLSLSNMRKYVTDCPYSPIPLEITENEVWDFDIRIYNDIIVKSGATLTITCAVRMPKDAKIVVERGAKLIVDGGLITNACENERWQGIEVWGNAGQAHQTFIDPIGAFTGEYITATTAPLSNYENAALTANAPGIVILKNDATLENGPNGTITTQRRGGYFPEYYGGIVVAENAHFVNCKRGVEFMQYAKHLNYSRFKDCTFQNTIPEANFAGISIWDCKRIIVDNCTFDYDAEFPIPSATTYRFGIEAYDARKLLVRNGGDFLRLKEGIKLACSTTTTATIGTNEMNPNVFEETTTGIQSLGRNTLIAENNQFTGTPTLHNGIVLGMAHNQYYVHNNQFTSMKTGVTANSTGVTEISDNNIECNRFDYCKTGILSAGQNDGLQFYDNQFLTTLTDVKVRQILGENGSVQEVQGWVNDLGIPTPFFNFFSLDRPLDRITTASTTDLFWYYYHTDPEYTAVSNNRLVPQCYIGDDCGFSYNYIGIDIEFPGGFSYKGCLNPYVDLEPAPLAPPDTCQSRECYEALREQVTALRSEIDGGNTEGLLSDLSAAPEALSTYQALMAASPYLSDELLAAIANNALMPLGRRSNLLIANAPLSDDLMNIAYAQLSEASYQVLYTIKYYLTLSDRDRLQMRISSENDRREKWLRELLDKYSDTENYSDMESLLNAENTLFALRTLVNAKIDQDDWEAAQSIVNNLPTDTPEEQDYRTVQQINLQRLSDSGAFVLSAEQEAALYSIANAYGHQAPAAQTILTLLTGAQFDWVIDDDDDSGSNKTETQQPRYPKAALCNLKTLKQLTISPNPMNKTASLLLPPFDLGQTATLQIFDVAGNLLQTQTLPTNATTATLEAKNLRNGLYIVALYADGVVLSQGKLIVQH